MQTVLLALAVLAILGAVFGLILAFASKIFAVEQDPREQAIAESLPGANCGGCGYPGCGGYAAAVVKGEAPLNACAAGGAAVAARIAEIMGATVSESVKQVAFVRCDGGGAARLQYQYEGITDCLAASRLPGGGPLACSFGCLGFGSCVKVCDFGALSLENGVAKVDPERCVACKKCVQTCPRGLIALVPYGSGVQIPCSSRDKGVDTRAVCESGCIGCGLCARACPNGAVTLANNLASIDPAQCVACGACVEKCPRHLIRLTGEPRETAAAAL